MSKPICCIVGMGPGISMSVAEKFGSNAFQIAMIARNKSKLDSYQSELQEKDCTSTAFCADVSDFESLRTAFDDIHEKLGHIDVLIYNVSVFREATPTQLDAETSVQDFRANVAGALVSVQAVCDYMKANKKGMIFLTGGGQALDPYPPFSSLGIGKAGIRNLAFSLAGELNPHGIHVSTITVNGAVNPATKFAPKLIAEEFWRIFNLKPGEYELEMIFE